MSNLQGRSLIGKGLKDPSSLAPDLGSFTLQDSRQGCHARPKMRYIGESYLHRIIPRTGTDPPTFLRLSYRGVRMMKVRSGIYEI